MDKIEPVNKTFKLTRNSNKAIKSSNGRKKTDGTKSDSIIISSKANSLNKSRASKQVQKIRTDLVEKFKKSINNGTYKAKAKDIAEKMVQKLKEEIYYKPLP